MSKLTKADDIHADGWERFERAVDVVAKSPPQHHKSRDIVGKRRLNMQPSPFEGGENGKETLDEGGGQKDGKKGD
jgi:hypothetical protein